MFLRVLSGAAVGAFLVGAALAGPVSEFETNFRATYGIYRAALFQTNTGDAEAAARSAAALAQSLDAIRADYGDTPPPQYADDPEWAATLDGVSSLVTAAKGQIAGGNLAKAHETLEGVRDLIGDLHARNGVETFSDRMNAYHAEMEHVLAADMSVLDADAALTLRERAAVLDYLARDVLAAPPADAAGNDEYSALSGAFEKSVAAFLAATRSGDPEAIRAAASGLKAPYSKLFLKFG